MTFRRWLALALIMMPVCSFPLVALEWKAQTQTATTAPFQAELSVVFEFTNSSPKPVTIREIETSCSCLRADSDLKVYAPGAAGKIIAYFTVSDRGGLYERGITVITDEPDSPSHLLVKVEVPEVAFVKPRSVQWRVNDEPTEKSVEIETLSPLQIDFSKAESTSEAYTVRIEAIEAGRRYRVYLKPKFTDHPSAAAVRLYGRERSGHDVLLSAYVSVN